MCDTWQMMREYMIHGRHCVAAFTHACNVYPASLDKTFVRYDERSLALFGNMYQYAGLLPPLYPHELDQVGGNVTMKTFLTSCRLTSPPSRVDTAFALISPSYPLRRRYDPSPKTSGKL